MFKDSQELLKARIVQKPEELSVHPKIAKSSLISGVAFTPQKHAYA